MCDKEKIRQDSRFKRKPFPLFLIHKKANVFMSSKTLDRDEYSLLNIKLFPALYIPYRARQLER